MTQPIDRSAFTAAGLAARVAAMIYEALLIFGVIFAVSYVILASMRWSYPLAPAPRTIVQLALFVTIGAYFVSCWTRTGQTLALKAWRLRVIDATGRPPGVVRAAVRYLLAWHLWLPGLAIAAVLRLPTVQALAVITGTFGVLLLPALFDSDRRLLHERWSGTRLVRVPEPRG